MSSFSFSFSFSFSNSRFLAMLGTITVEGATQPAAIAETKL
jgi:hypothetical protein